MNILCDLKAFRAALAVAGKVIPAKHPVPILMALKIVTNDNRATLIGSDGDTTFEMDIPASVLTEGAACIPFATLATFCGAAKADQISIDVADGRATLKAGRSKITLSTSDVLDYPNYRPSDGDLVTMDAEVFCHALRFCAAAVEDDDVRFNIAGVNLNEGAGELSLWGTNGKCMHHAVIADVDGIGGGATIPIAAVPIIMGIAEKVNVIKFGASDRGWHIYADPIRAWGKVIDAAYPDVARVVNGYQDWADFVTAGREELTGAITVATCGADADSQKSRNIIIISADDAPVILRGQKGVAGVIHAGRAELEARGKLDMRIVMASRNLIAAMSGIKADEFAMSIGARRTDGERAAMIRPAQASAVLSMSALFSTIRATEAEMADV